VILNSIYKGVRFTDLLSNSPLVSSVISQRYVMQKQAALAILQGLGRAGDVYWDDINETVREVLMNVTMNAFSEIEAQQSPYEDAKISSNILHSLGRLHCQWNSSNFPREIRRLLVNKLVPQSLETNVPSGSIVSHAVNGLSRMGAHWIDLEQTFLSSPSGSKFVLHSINEMTTQELATTLWSLGIRKICWSDIDEQIRLALKSRFGQTAALMTAYEFAWSLWAVARMDIKWNDDFTESERSTLISAADIAAIMTQQEIGVLLWALVKVQAPPSDYSKTLNSKLVQNVELLLQS
jgi:hypothetical protein